MMITNEKTTQLGERGRQEEKAVEAGSVSAKPASAKAGVPCKCAKNSAIFLLRLHSQHTNIVQRMLKPASGKCEKIGVQILCKECLSVQQYNVNLASAKSGVPCKCAKV